MSQEIAVITAHARPIGPNMTYVREETIIVSEPLTDAERLECGQEMADALGKIEEYEAALDTERKHYKRLIFGRRSTDSFDVRRLDGTRISAGISFKKLRLLERRRTYLTELRKEAALPPLPEGRGLRADF